MIVAYLINQYPRPSHSFIRREILALESHGVSVHRFSIRPFADVVDEADKAEQSKTHVVLSAAGIFFSTIAAMFSRPRGFFSALKLAIRVSRKSDRGAIVNLIYFAEACHLLRLLRRLNVQHLHAHFGTNSATVAMYTRELGGPPYSFTCHGPEEFDRPEFLALDEKVARSAFAVAISYYGRSQLYRWTAPRHWPKIHVVHCGVDRMFLASSNDQVPSAPRLVCVGRLAEQKGQLLLCQAAARLAREGLDFEINLVGAGPMRRDIEAEIERCDLSKIVKITGWMSNAEVRREIQSSRALVLPSFAEGLPVVIMEALALRRPVISTYVAGIPELVEPGVCGWLVPAGAIEPLIDAMRDALTAPVDRLARMGAAGADRVAQNHDAAREAAKLADLFARSLGVSSMPAIVGSVALPQHA